MTFNVSIPGVRVSTDAEPETAGHGAQNSGSELLDEIVARLANIAKVLEREHAWLLPKVTEARADLAAEIGSGHKTEEFDGGWDDLLIKSKQMDTHLSNISTAVEMLDDIGAIVKASFRVDERPSS